jgi:hypothetical protein
MNWLWLNISLAALIFLAVTGTPLWLVIKHPDTAPAWPEAPEGGATRQPRPALTALPAATPDPRAQAEREAASETVGAAA